MKISVITPTLNAAPQVERAIRSVLLQCSENFEHIFVDGGSTDGTLEKLREFPHLKVIVASQSNQVSAMNIGFSQSTGDIIVYLNADDYFLECAFDSVLPEFHKGANFVVGNVLVKSGRGRLEFLNTPRTDLKGMLRHWERDAFCYNPVGYFYRREVQEKCPFNPLNDHAMDLEFLLSARSQFDFVKIEKTLGCYQDDIGTKTYRNQIADKYWTPEMFAFVDDYISALSGFDLAVFERDRIKGYRKLSTYWHRKQKYLHAINWIKAFLPF